MEELRNGSGFAVRPDSTEPGKEIQMSPTEMDEMEKSLPANGSAGNVARTLDNAGARLHGAIDKMSASAVPAVNRAASRAHVAVDQVTQAAGGAADSLAAKADELRATQSRLTEDCRGYVRENPLASVGIALATGYLLSRALNRR
jgi:ElaB/YqjD/DUF883 family membrane-anchored ribosome-binding protein